MTDKHYYQSGKISWSATPDGITGDFRPLQATIDGSLVVTGDLNILGNSNSTNSTSLNISNAKIYANFGVDDIQASEPGLGLVIDRGSYAIVTVTSPDGPIKIPQRMAFKDGFWVLTIDGSGEPVWRDDQNYSYHGQDLSNLDYSVPLYMQGIDPSTSQVVLPRGLLWDNLNQQWDLSWPFTERRGVGGTVLPVIPVAQARVTGVATPTGFSIYDVPNVKFVNDAIAAITLGQIHPGTNNFDISYWNTTTTDWQSGKFAIVHDLVPKLGGNLDVTGFMIGTLVGSNTDINLTPDSGLINVVGPGNSSITTGTGENLYIRPKGKLGFNENFWPLNKGSVNQVIADDGTGYLYWRTLPADVPVAYDIHLKSATPGAVNSGDTLDYKLMVRPMNILSSSTQCKARLIVPPSGNAQYVIKKSGINVAAINFIAGQSIGTVSIPSNINIVSGDLIEVVADIVDASANGLVITLGAVLA